MLLLQDDETVLSPAQKQSAHLAVQLIVDLVELVRSTLTALSRPCHADKKFEEASRVVSLISNNSYLL